MQGTKINNFKIKPIVSNIISDKPWNGKDVFPGRQYFNLALLSHTGSGKTTVIYNLVKKFRDPHTVFMIFSSTYQLDPTYTEMIKWINSKKNELLVHDHFLQGTGSDKINLIEQFMEEYKNMLDEDGNSEPEEKKGDLLIQRNPSTNLALLKYFASKGINLDKATETPKKTKADLRKKLQKLNFIIIIDDLSKDLRKGNTIETLLKKSRHYHARVFISSQTLSDIAPSSHAQLYALCLFSGMGEKDVEYIFNRYDMPVTKERFLQQYKEVIKTKYNFLTILPNERELRINLDTKLIS